MPDGHMFAALLLSASCLFLKSFSSSLSFTSFPLPATVTLSCHKAGTSSQYFLFKDKDTMLCLSHVKPELPFLKSQPPCRQDAAQAAKSFPFLLPSKTTCARKLMSQPSLPPASQARNSKSFSSQRLTPSASASPFFSHSPCLTSLKPPSFNHTTEFSPSFLLAAAAVAMLHGWPHSCQGSSCKFSPFTLKVSLSLSACCCFIIDYRLFI